MSDDLKQQDAIDEAAAHDFMERSVMCAEVTLPGATARAIARYISNLEVESDNDLAGVRTLAQELMQTSDALVKQNAELKASLRAADARHADAVRLLRELRGRLEGQNKYISDRNLGQNAEDQFALNQRSIDRIDAFLAKEADK